MLQNAFLKAKTGRLARMVLDAVANIYSSDHSNYFILEAQHTLSQFAERVQYLPEVQAKYFELLEFVVFVLNYVPCKELFSVSVLLKSSTSYGCSITATRTLLKLGRHHVVFSDVFREVGLLEVLVNLLHKYAALLKEPAQGHGEQGKILLCLTSVWTCVRGYFSDQKKKKSKNIIRADNANGDASVTSRFPDELW